jgi:hypothetical protein
MTATPYRLKHIRGDRWRVMKGKRLVVRSESLKRAQEIMEALMVEYLKTKGR